MSRSNDIPFGRPWITDDDREAVQQVLQGHILTHGPQCKAFEEEFAAFLGEGAYCVTVSSCTAALHLAYLELGIGPGDDVIVPAQTHSATAHAVELVGARPIFVDCDRATGNVNANGIAAAVTPHTKALSVVHFVGIPCNMPNIMAIAKKYGLKVIEDCAIALGARYEGKHVGLFGDAGCFSFYPVKHITTGEGGMFVSRYRELAEAVGKLRALGVDRTHTERAIPGMYEVLTAGLNYRMSEIQASLGRTQLRRIEANLERRRANFEALKHALAKLSGLRVLDSISDSAESSHYCLSVVFEGNLAGWRNEIIARLNAVGIGTSIYYPQPVPRMRYYHKKYGYDASRYTVAAEISDHSIALPVAPHVISDHIMYMAEQFTRVVKEMR